MLSERSYILVANDGYLGSLNATEILQTFSFTKTAENKIFSELMDNSAKLLLIQNKHRLVNPEKLLLL